MHAPARPATQDVPDVGLPAEGAFRYLKLSFGARADQEALTLVEVEVLGRP